MKKHHLCITSLVCMTLLTGCSQLAYTEEYVDYDTTTASLQSETTDDFTETVETEAASDSTVVFDADSENVSNSLTLELPVKGEEFKLICTYDTGDYPLDKWRITADKLVNMTVKTAGLPDGYSVHIEHVHADISLKATDPQIDGITQDSMDDSDHRIPTKGFPIGNDIEYNCIFAIEGYTHELYESWGYVCNGYGYTTSSETRLSESNLINEGTYAEKLAVVYDIVITPPDYEEGYVKSVYSSVLIPVSGETKTRTITKDILTGEVVDVTIE